MPHDQQSIAVQLVTRAGCAHCAKAKQDIAEAVTAAGADHPVALTEVDLVQHLELLDQYDIWATPALIINDELTFVGKVDERQLREKLAAVVGC